MPKGGKKKSSQHPSDKPRRLSSVGGPNNRRASKIANHYKKNSFISYSNNKRTRDNIAPTKTIETIPNDSITRNPILTQEDIDFFEKNQDMVCYLDNMDCRELVAPIKKKKNVTDSSYNNTAHETYEEDYSSQSRAWSNTIHSDEGSDTSHGSTISKKNKLPIKIENELADFEQDPIEEVQEEQRLFKWAQDKEIRLAKERLDKANVKKAKKRAKIEVEDESEDEISEDLFSSRPSTILDTECFSPEQYLQDPKAEFHILLGRQNEITRHKNDIAKLSTTVTNFPDRNIHLIPKIQQYADHQDLGVRKLAIFSLLAVFCDIIPSYRIIKDNVSVKLSRDIKQLRVYEHAMLGHYQSYLDLLEKILKQNPSSKQSSFSIIQDNDSTMQLHSDKIDIIIRKAVAYAAAKALGKLLVKHPHFNFSSSIISMLVPLLISSDAKLASIASANIAAVFQQDIQFYTSLEIIRFIYHFVKKKEFKVRPPILDVLLHLRISVPLEEGVDILNLNRPFHRDDKHMSKPEYRDYKKQREIDRKLKPIETAQKKELIETVQSEILKFIFLIYFQFLKNNPTSDLITSVLEGVAHYSHLINIELLLSMIDYLRELIPRKLTLSCSLYLVITAFQAIRLQGNTLLVDLKDFYFYLYNLLDSIVITIEKHAETMPLLLRAIELSIFSQKMSSIERLASYLKKMLLLSLHLPLESLLSFLVAVQRLLHKYPQLGQLLDSEVCGSGNYDPYLNDPDHCNSFGSTAWEFTLLYEHYHPNVVYLVKLILNQQEIVPQDLVNTYEKFQFAKTGFTPALVKPKMHVFQKTIQRIRENAVSTSSQLDHDGELIEQTQEQPSNKVFFIKPSKMYGDSPFLKKLIFHTQSITRADVQVKMKNYFQQFSH